MVLYQQVKFHSENMIVIKLGNKIGLLRKFKILRLNRVIGHFRSLSNQHVCHEISTSSYITKFIQNIDFMTNSLKVSKTDFTQKYSEQCVTMTTNHLYY